MDLERLNSRSFRAGLLLVPFFLMAAVTLPYLFGLARALAAPVFLIAAAEHALLLLSLSAVCANLFLELLLGAFTETAKTGVYALLYGGKRFFPLRAGLFVAVFLAGYVLLTQRDPYGSALRALILLVPPAAILINAPHFLSGRVRTVGGRCILCDGRFHSVHAYFTDGGGVFCVVDEEGRTVSTGIPVADLDLPALERALAASGGQRPQPGRGGN